MNKRQLIIILSTVLFLGGSAGLKLILENLKEVKEEVPKAEAIRYVKTADVVYGDAISEVHATGRILSLSEFDLSTEVGGVLATGSVKLKKGGSFRKGDVLVRIVNDEGVFALKAQKSRFLNTLASFLPDMRIDYTEEYAKWQKFFDEIDLDKPLPALPKIGSNREKIFLATRNVLSDYYSIMANEVRLEKFTLVAPYDGAFANVYLEAGSVVNMGSRIAQIIKTAALEVEVPIEIDFSKWVNAGDKVSLSNNDKSVTWSGTVIRKSDFVDPQSQSISIFVSVDNTKKEQLYKGMYLYASFPGVELNQVMEVPRNAIFNGNMVYVVVEGKLKQRSVEVVKLNETTAFFAGLAVGERLVTEALVNAKEGMLVESIEKKPTMN